MRPPLFEVPTDDFYCPSCSEEPGQDAATQSKKGKKGEKLSAVEKTKMKAIVSKLMKMKDAKPFNSPVSTKEVPEYLKTVKTPMDFGTIMDKIQDSSYSSIYEFIEDIHLVFANCIQFNGHSNQYTKDVKNVAEQFETLMKSSFGEGSQSLISKKRTRETQDQSDTDETPSKRAKTTRSLSDSEGSSKKSTKKQTDSQGDQESSAKEYLEYAKSAQPQPQNQQVIEASHRAIMKNLIGSELQQLISSTTSTAGSSSSDQATDGPMKVTCNKFVVKARVGSLNQLQSFIKRSFGIADGDYRLFYQDKKNDKVDITTDEGFDTFLHDSNHIYVALSRAGTNEARESKRQ